MKIEFASHVVIVVFLSPVASLIRPIYAITSAGPEARMATSIPSSRVCDLRHVLCRRMIQPIRVNLFNPLKCGTVYFTIITWNVTVCKSTIVDTLLLILVDVRCYKFSCVDGPVGKWFRYW
jgi:hypothetical protein